MLPDDGGHIALFYRTEHDYLTSVAAFIETGLAAGDPAFIAVPGPKIGPLRDALGPQAGSVAFADMTEMGRNPAWIIPRVQAFIDASEGRHAWYVGEPIWAERTPEELREATRHEALINLAFSGVPATILCPYDTSQLAMPVLADAECTHPSLQHSGVIRRSGSYRGPADLPRAADGPLPPGPPQAASLTYRADLSRVRALVGRQANQAGLPPRRAADLVLAVSEVAANTIRHTGGDGTLRVWHDPREVVCELSDPGHIKDPLAGRRRPPSGSPGGHGLWIVHQACDLVEMRSGPRGTTIRLHMARDTGRLPREAGRLALALALAGPARHELMLVPCLPHGNDGYAVSSGAYDAGTHAPSGVLAPRATCWGQASAPPIRPLPARSAFIHLPCESQRWPT
jgi:anti-sigma regulatory factor (Ser/Thr protein kinase)